MKVWNTAIQWLVLLTIAFSIWYFWGRVHLPVFPSMPGYMVLFFALAFSFMWVEKLKWGVTKPFNCLGCMTAWAALALAFLFHTPFWYLYLPGGLLIGSVFTAFKYRWL